MRKETASKDNLETIEWLSRIRWPKGPICLACRKKDTSRLLQTRGLYQCTHCRAQFSVFKGTVFEGTRLSPTALRNVLLATHSLIKLGRYSLTGRRLMKVTGMKSFSTANRLLERIDPVTLKLYSIIDKDRQMIAMKSLKRRLSEKNQLTKEDADSITKHELARLETILPVAEDFIKFILELTP